MILSLISQKGGVGKSALARLLAVEFAKAGWQVKIADLDPAQGTSTQWKLRRDQNEFMPDIPVEKYRTVNAAIAAAPQWDLLILDGPAHAEQGGKTMAKASDLVILPTGYSIDDLEPQVTVAYALEEDGVPSDKILLVFSRAKGSPAEDKDARAYIRRARLTVLDAVVPELASIRQAHALGLAASEVSFPSVKESVMTVANAIAQKLTEGSANGTK